MLMRKVIYNSNNEVKISDLLCIYDNTIYKYYNL